MLIRADARYIPLRDKCVQTVVTSPPYWGLRDYGTAKWVGGDPACDHSPERRGGRFATPVSAKQATSNTGSGTISRRDCDCGAVRADAQIGLEPTPDEFVQSMVQVFAEVWRVLKDDGTVWCNLGDIYCSGTAAPRKPTTTSGPAVPASWANRCQRERIPAMGMIKPKDLVGIPWRVAFALQAAGWYLRSDIIWSKPNPMPESVTDRPTKAHEYIFLLSKSERYYYDASAIAEPVALSTIQWGGGKTGWGASNPLHATPSGTHGPSLRGQGRCGENGENRNKRSVWHVATQPYSGSHFATFPEALIEPCILAGSRVGDLVFDPFIGSGTVGVVAERSFRRWVGTDLSYQHLSAKRTAQRGLVEMLRYSEGGA